MRDRQLKSPDAEESQTPRLTMPQVSPGRPVAFPFPPLFNRALTICAQTKPHQMAQL